MTTLQDMVEPVLKKAGKGESLSRDEFLILLLDRIFLRASNSFFNGQFSYLPRAASGLKPGKILVILFSSIGDVVYSTPVISALREKYPDSFISFLVEEDAYPAAILGEHPFRYILCFCEQLKIIFSHNLTAFFIFSIISTYKNGNCSITCGRLPVNRHR